MVLPTSMDTLHFSAREGTAHRSPHVVAETRDDELEGGYVPQHAFDEVRGSIVDQVYQERWGELRIDSWSILQQEANAPAEGEGQMYTGEYAEEGTCRDRRDVGFLQGHENSVLCE